LTFFFLFFSFPEDYYDPEGFPDSTVTLVSLNDAFSPKRVAIPEGKTVVFGRLTSDSTDSPVIPKFQSKVVSRQHCILTYQGGKFLIKDTGSSSGTFLLSARFGDNPYRLSEQGRESNLFEVYDGDTIQLGEDFDQGGSMRLFFRVPFL